ncbi:MAG: shikimate kinase [Balneolales bacterium]
MSKANEQTTNSSTIHILICGFMASGKSSIGRLVAHDLHKPFFDLDKIIERDEGKSISNIFTEHGESYFRELELRYLNSLLDAESSLIALGGGALHNEEVVNYIKEKNLLVYLDIPLPIIIDRLTGNRTRPMLFHKDGSKREIEELKAYLYDLHKKRESLYVQSQIRIKVDPVWNRNTAAEKVAQYIREYEPQP